MFITHMKPMHEPIGTRLARQGHGRDRLYLIPSGHFRATGRESVTLPSVDDLI